MIRQIETADWKERICRAVLQSLPDWFGNPDSIEEYAQKCREIPVWADLDGERIRGFIAFRPTSPHAGEICVMGVRQDCHRQGVGKALVHALYDYAAQEGYRFLTVKTVQMGFYEDYDRTNLFYQAQGFVELECFPTLWDEANPCQVYIMDVRANG